MKRYELKWAMVASFEGINPGAWHPCENFPADAVNAWPLDNGLDETTCGSAEELEENPSEYDSGLWMDADFDGGDEVQFVTVSGILSRRECFDFLDSMGAMYEDCGTMGTLGGPLGGLVPDFPYRTEGRMMVSSIRITPILCKDGEPVRAPLEWEWVEIERILKGYDCFDISLSGRAVKS